MGMSASQGRLLSLTARMSDLEFEAQGITNCKIRLADKSESATKEYANALSKKKLVVAAGINSNTGAPIYKDATASVLTSYNAISSTEKQRLLKDASGRLIVSSSIAKKFNDSRPAFDTYSQAAPLQSTPPAPAANPFGGSGATGNPIGDTGPGAGASTGDTGAGGSTGAGGGATGNPIGDTGPGAGANTGDTGAGGSTGGSTGGAGGPSGGGDMNPGGSTLSYGPANLDNFLKSCGVVADSTKENFDQAKLNWYTNIFNEMSINGYNAQPSENFQSKDWLYSELKSGNIYLEEWDLTSGGDGSGTFDSVSWSSGDYSLVEQADDSDLALIEAEYNAKMAEIQTKDKKFDLNLKKIDVEHNAVKTEIDSVKKVIDDNISRSFKTFNG